LDTCHLDRLYLREQGCEDQWLFFEAIRGPRAGKFGKHWSIVFFSCVQTDRQTEPFQVALRRLTHTLDWLKCSLTMYKCSYWAYTSTGQGRHLLAFGFLK
jgi:hypothetical protein